MTRWIVNGYIRTQQFEEVLKDWYRVVVLDQPENEACVHEVIATDELGWELFLQVEILEANVVW